MPVAVRPASDTCTTDDAACTDVRSGSAASPTSARPPVPPPVGRVADILEVWRIDDEWWRTPIARRYVDVVLESGAHVVLLEDLHTGAWFVQQP
jgi:hypothetical protein